jgi:DNA-binding NarL/FixJ family response regulator
MADRSPAESAGGSDESGVAIRVALVDDDPLVRSALSLMLGGRPDLTVVAEAGDGAEVPDMLRAARPDVVLMDIRMPKVDGIEATRRAMEAASPPQVIVLTTFDTDDHVLGAIAAGAQGFLVKDTPPEDVVAAIKTVAAGESILSPSVTSKVVAHVRRGAPPGPVAEAEARLRTLTDREREVAVAVGRGLSNAEVAAELHLSVATVKAHVSRLFDKLNATNRVQVAICVHDAGLV